MPVTPSRILMLTLLLFTCLSSWSTPPKDKSSVIVIGAGLTGLSAAIELQKSGLLVTVLEASAHTGKPVYSFTSDFIQADTDVKNMPSDELLNEEVHEQIHGQIHGYLALLGLQVTDTASPDTDEYAISSKPMAANTAIDSLQSHYYLNGKLISFQDLSQVFAQHISPDYQRFWLAFNQLTQRQVAKLETEVKAQRKKAQPYSIQLSPPLSTQDWLNSLNLHPAALMLAKHHLEAIYDKSSQLSLLSLARVQGSRNHERDRQAQVRRIVGGDSLMANVLATKLTKPVLLNHKITSIKHTKTGVVVKAGGKIFRAQQLLISQALPKLAQLNISPVLPADILSSSQHLNYGAYNKVLLQYQSGFMALVNASSSHELPMGWNRVQTHDANALSNTLTTYTSGGFIDGQSYISTEHIIAIKRAQLAAKFPGIDKLFISASVQAWHREPWPGGHYISYQAKEINHYWDNFKLPVRNIYFASGQRDSLYPGSFSGAARAGVQAAQAMSQHAYMNSNSSLASGY
ncbi:MAG: FAD-dependent oxidoreductase [Bermanella sp.]